MISRVDMLLQTHPELSRLDMVGGTRSALAFGRGDRISHVAIGAGPLHYWDEGWRPIDHDLIKDSSGAHTRHIPYRVDVEGAEHWRGNSFLPYSIGEYKNGYRPVHRIGQPLVHGSRLVRPAGSFRFESKITNTTVRDYLILNELPGFGDPYIGIEYKGSFPKNCGAQLPFASDANGRRILCDVFREEGSLILAVPSEWLMDATYPVHIDPDIDNCNDCWEGGDSSFTYTTTHDDCQSSTQCDGVGSSFRMGQRTHPGLGYIIARHSLKYFLEGLSGTVTDVTMDLAIEDDWSEENEFDIQIAKADNSADDVCGGGSTCQQYYNAGHSATDQALRNTSGISVDTVYTSPSLSTTWVQDFMDGGDYVYYGIRSSRDYAQNILRIDDEVVVREDVSLYCCNAGTYEPVLTLTGTFVSWPGSQPVIVPAFG